MSILIQEFTSLPTEEETSLESDDTRAVRYYVLYVYRIVSYLVQIIQEHLGKFSDKLNDLASPVSSDEDVRIDLDKEKSIPVKPDFRPDRKFPARYFKFKPYMPTHKISVDGCTCKSKSSSKHLSSNSKYNQNEYCDRETIRHNLKKECKALTDSYDNLIHILKSIHELGELFRILSSRIGMPSKYDHHKFLSSFVKTAIDDVADSCKRKIFQDCCTAACNQCCEVCKTIHKTLRKKERFRGRKWGTPGSHDIPILRSEPFWLCSEVNKGEASTQLSDSEPLWLFSKVNKGGSSTPLSDSEPREMEYKNTADTQTETSRECNESPALCKRTYCEYGKKEHFTDECKIHSNEPFSFSRNIFKLLNEKNQKIVPGKATRNISRGHLKPPPPPPMKMERSEEQPSRKRIPIIQKSRSCNFQRTQTGEEEDTPEGTVDESQEKQAKPEEDDKPDDYSGNRTEPLYLKDIKEKICTPSNMTGGFCLIPGICSSSRPIRDVLIQKTDDADWESPGEITFEISKFVTSLKEKFKHFLDIEHSLEMSENSEDATIVLDIVFDSVGEAISICKAKDDDDLVPEVRNIATQVQMENIIQVPLDEMEEGVPYVDSPLVVLKCPEKSRSENQIFPPRNKSRRKTFHACKECLEMIEPIPCQIDDVHQCTEKCLLMQSLKTTCLTCMNARERGFTIHECHERLPSGVMEMRHMDESGKICVCFLFRNRKKEADDWRWQKNPFDDPTRVEIEQSTNLDKNPIFKVIFGPEGTMLKESLAETQLLLVCDSAFPTCPIKKQFEQSKEKRPNSTSLLYKGYRKSKVAAELANIQKQGTNERDRKQLAKLARFFDDIQRVGYGKGPPLISELITSTTNFQDEDETNRLFELFERELFGSKEKQLFVHPSEETQCIYFNPDFNSHPQWFLFAGTVLALAIIHQKKLNLKFPICLFKCLLDRTLDIDDLKEIDPLTYQQLMWIKSNDITKTNRKMTFTIKEKTDDLMVETDLMPDGSKIAVTQKNKYRYIDLVVKWKLAERCLTQLKDFRSGFANVIEPGFLKHFTEKELRSLIRHPPSDPEFYLKECGSYRITNEIQRRGTC